MTAFYTEAIQSEQQDLASSSLEQELRAKGQLDAAYEEGRRRHAEKKAQRRANEQLAMETFMKAGATVAKYKEDKEDNKDK